MALAKFSVGQVVDFLPGGAGQNIPRGQFTITRVMPAEGDLRSYRVRGSADGQERAVQENQIQAAFSASKT
jgi:hypothetical protein